MTTAIRTLAAGGVLVGLAAGAAAQIPWSEPSGTGNFFTWANGQNATGLFGSPLLVAGTQFVFFPDAFTANSGGGGQHAATDTFSVDLHALVGYKFTEIRIETLGDYSILGTGSVNVSGTLNINELGAPGRTTSDDLVGSQPFPATTGQNVAWSAVAARDLSLIEFGVPFTDIHISFSNNLLAISGGAGDSAVINKSVVGFPIAVTIIPAPGAAVLLGLGGLVAMRRRR